MESQYNVETDEPTVTANNDLLTQMNKFKNDYYSQNNKNMFFKKKQKNDCAQQISTMFEQEMLFQKTIYQIPNTANIYMDYTIFKLYANEHNYHDLVKYILSIYDKCIDSYGYYIIHVNLQSFSVSAAERYKTVIQLFNQACIRNTQRQYIDHFKSWYIYNPPHVVDTITKILRPIMEPTVMQNVIVVSKADSDEALRKLFL